MNIAAPPESAPRTPHPPQTPPRPLSLRIDPLPSPLFKQYSINKTCLTVGAGEQRVSHVTHGDGFIVYILHSACAPEVTETWSIYVVHEASGDQTPTKILSYSCTELECGSTPSSIHISEDRVLVVSLGVGGLKTYGLRYDGFNAQADAMIDLSMPGHYHLFNKWIATSSEGHCLVSRTTTVQEDTLWVYSCITGRRNTQDLLNAQIGTILDVGAAAPGNVAVLLYTHKVHTLTRTHKGDFEKRTIDLEVLGPGTTPVCLAIGNRMLMVSVVSVLNAPTSDPSDPSDPSSGDLLCFNLKSGELTNRRRCQGVASAVATDGSRCLFGVTSPGESALYCVYEGQDATFVFSDHIGEMEWTQGSVHIDRDAWSCAVTYKDEREPGYNSSVVEFCTAVERYQPRPR